MLILFCPFIWLRISCLQRKNKREATVAGPDCGGGAVRLRRTGRNTCRVRQGPGGVSVRSYDRLYYLDSQAECVYDSEEQSDPGLDTAFFDFGNI